MTFTEATQLATTVIVALGGGGAIVLSLSHFLGKTWAERLMAKEKATHDEQLEELRAELARKNDTALSELRTALQLAKDKHLSAHSDKVKIYRLVVDIVAELLGDLDSYQLGGLPPEQAAQCLDKFNRGRMRAYGYLAMLAPQSVMSAADSLFDDLIQIGHGQLPYEWPRVRTHILGLLNTVRVDIGFDPAPIKYDGNL